MDREVEHELCANCKKEIPQHNYVMHTAHCARNITLCKSCNEPIPKSKFDDHKKQCEKTKVIKKPAPPPTTLEKSSYFQERKLVEDQKIANRKERYLQKHERLVDTGYSLNSPTRQSSTDKNLRGTPPPSAAIKKEPAEKNKPPVQNGAVPRLVNPPAKSSGMLACKFCDLELPKLDLDEHENYCGSRTDKCLECGELVMFKYKQVHMDSNHGFLKLKDEPGPRPSWDSTTQRSSSSSGIASGLESSYTPRRRPSPLTSFNFDYDPMPYMPQSYSAPGGPPGIKIEKGESYKEISRRLDCKTEYIRNLLHDSASITVPLRHSGAVPRNHFNHNKGPAPQPPRRRNPPTELTVPCEFCHVTFPHEDLVDHENICRLARMPRRHKSPEEDDYFIAPQPSSPEVELPCEFCADMIPASQLLRHQATCS
ncbi:unnamed protein product [Brassicogethes aeneus]|uniref:TRAFD1/XAF1 zinc finger domain-containing protein n=1 Tax=Brassicogethes aeneus TaxID=1431903 RepID=A0A9P0AVS3_BRAAE|nr:unnamed protein product [Brassicogethes aeneus]